MTSIEESSLAASFRKAQAILGREFSVRVVHNDVDILPIDSTESMAWIATELLNQVKARVTLLALVSDNEELEDIHTTDLQ
jgi:hypothetical protein